MPTLPNKEYEPKDLPKAIVNFSGHYRFLSNFLEYPCIWKGEKYNSSEHAFQSAKATNESDRKYVACAIGPGQAKMRGRRIKIRENWDDIKDDIMLDILRAKFSTGPTLGRLLLQTNDYELIEGNFWGDTYWGVCEGKGYNKLGILLMQVRDELKAKENSNAKKSDGPPKNTP